jgi:hypothetical protein
VGQIQKRRHLVEHHRPWLLRQGAGDHHALALAVAQFRELPVGELTRSGRLEGAVDGIVIRGGQTSHRSGVRMPAERYEVSGGQPPGLDLLCQHDGQTLGAYLGREGVEVVAVEEHASGERRLQPHIVRISVDLPAPFGPTRTVNSPASSVTLRPDVTARAARGIR